MVVKCERICALLAVLISQVPQESKSPAESRVLAPPVRLECDTGPIDTGKYTGHAGPLFADLDGDGKEELLVGNFGGYLQLYANTGERGKPKLVAKGLLQADGADAHVENW